MAESDDETTWCCIPRRTKTNEEATPPSDESKVQRLPDTVLRLIFQKLDFVDIKSCRLVSRQWDRHALDNVNFLLAVEPIGPTKSRWKRAFQPAAKTSQDRFRFKLVGFPTSFDEQAIRKAVESSVVRKSEQKWYFQQLATAVERFKFKVKFVQLFISPMAKQLLPTLHAFFANFPAAELLCATGHYFGDEREIGVWAAFERDRQTINLVKREPVKLRKLVIQSAAAIAFVVLHCLTKQTTAHVREIITEFWIFLRPFLVAHLLPNIAQQQLVLEQCKKIVVRNPLDDADETPFRKLAVFSPNLEHLNWKIGNGGPGPDFEALEQLPQLKFLAIYTTGQHEISRLCLPNLTNLQLGRGIHLPDIARRIALTGLVTLKLQANRENLSRLAAHCLDCPRRLRDLKTLILTGVNQAATEEFLRPILAATTNPRALKIRTSRRVGDLRTISATCNAIADSAPDLTTLEIGQLRIDNETDCSNLVRQLIFWIQATHLKAKATISFRDNENGQLQDELRALEQTGNFWVNGDNVRVAMVTEEETSTASAYDFAWRSSPAGLRQKLRVRVQAQDQIVVG